MDRPALASVSNSLENVQLLKEELQTAAEGTEILVALRHMLSIPLIGGWCWLYGYPVVRGSSFVYIHWHCPLKFERKGTTVILSLLA